MKQMLIETRQKAEQLMQEALSIWRQSDQADYLEDIEKDPVFSLLMMALAYQSNEVDSEIERLKQDVLEDFARLLVPYEKGHAMPATALVKVQLQDNIPEMTMGETTPFQLGVQHSFLPLLGTRVLNADVGSVVRLDGRRWKVILSFRHPVTDLSHFAFALTDCVFQDISVSVKGKALPLIKPWQYAELPFAPYFSPDALTYNLGQVCNLSNLPMDLFARQNVRLFCVDSHDARQILPGETESLELVFEFVGVPDGFAFSKASLILNPVVLVNAQIHEATLTQDHPIVRLAGGKNDAEQEDISSRAFLHLIRPLENQLFENIGLSVRGVAGDRFNQAGLVKLLNCLITKYRSDFYAFQQLKGEMTDQAVFQLENALSRLLQESDGDALRNLSGVYLMADRRGPAQKQEYSLSVKYLTTAGAAVNGLLNKSQSFSANGYFLSEAPIIGIPVPGTDEMEDAAGATGLLRYQLLTDDRIVTPADIKLFCKKELLLRYGVEDSVIKRLRVDRRLQHNDNGCGYELVAEITLQGTSFVKRNLPDKLPMAEILLQKMIEVRSANIYPVRVQISIDEEE